MGIYGGKDGYTGTGRGTYGSGNRSFLERVLGKQWMEKILPRRVPEILQVLEYWAIRLTGARFAPSTAGLGLLNTSLQQDPRDKLGKRLSKPWDYAGIILLDFPLKAQGLFV